MLSANFWGWNLVFCWLLFQYRDFKSIFYGSWGSNSCPNPTLFAGISMKITFQHLRLYGILPRYDLSWRWCARKLSTPERGLFVSVLRNVMSCAAVIADLILSCHPLTFFGRQLSQGNRRGRASKLAANLPRSLSVIVNISFFYACLVTNTKREAA